MIGFVIELCLVTALWAGAVVLWVARRRMRRKLARLEEIAPKRTLLVLPPGGPDGTASGRVFDVQGTVVSAASLTAPLSGEPCVVWELRLDEVLPATEDRGERRQTLWRSFRSADLVVEYDARWDVDPDPRTGRPLQFPRDAPGRVTARADRVTPDLPGSPSGMIYPVLLGPVQDQRPALPGVLTGHGVEPALLERVRRDPQGFVVQEMHLPHGADVRLVQHSPDPRQSFPDPDAPFSVVPLGHDFGQSAAGCLATLLGAGAFLALALGVLVVLRFG